MKKFIKALLLSLLIAATAATAGCAEGGNSVGTAATTSTAAENTESPSNETTAEEMPQGGGTQTEIPPKEGLWETAKYTEDTEVGEGAVTVKVKVIADTKEITITVHTDKENLGAALLEYDLVSGDESQYGLYIKSVNGIQADYDKDQAWWAISKDGEMLMTGADSTPIADGENYELTYTKGSAFSDPAGAGYICGFGRSYVLLQNNNGVGAEHSPAWNVHNDLHAGLPRQGAHSHICLCLSQRTFFGLCGVVDTLSVSLGCSLGNNYAAAEKNAP